MSDRSNKLLGVLLALGVALMVLGEIWSSR